jgi:hypothetical protein
MTDRAHHRFDQTHSSTFKSLDIGMSVRFGSGKIYGSLGTDAVSIGPIAVKHQTFGLIEKEEGSIFMSGKFDGILGLSFPALSAAKGHKPRATNQSRASVASSRNQRAALPKRKV